MYQRITFQRNRAACGWVNDDLANFSRPCFGEGEQGGICRLYSSDGNEENYVESGKNIGASYTVWAKKVALLKLFAIFSRRLSVYFCEILPICCQFISRHTYQFWSIYFNPVTSEEVRKHPFSCPAFWSPTFSCPAISYPAFSSLHVHVLQFHPLRFR